MTIEILALLFFSVFFVERFAEILNLRHSRKPLPLFLQSVQTPEDHGKASRYLRDRLQVAWVRETLFLFVFLAFLALGGFGKIQEWAILRTSSHFWQAAIFVGALSLAQALINLPFSAYSTFVIEERYGFNRSTWKIFFGDAMKGLLVGVILGGLIFFFAVRMLENFGGNAWWIIWLGYTAFQFFLLWIAPVTILPLFLKLTPLPDGELKAAVEDYARKQNFKIDGVWVCDASKRSAKSNAFFTGFGRFRRLVLFDTLIEKHPVSEIVAIVAHEAGHFKLGHIWKGSLLSSLTTLGILLVLQKLVADPGLYESFYTVPGNLGIGLVLASIVLGKILFYVSPLGAYFSRRNEYSADEFSMDTTRNPEALLSGLKRLVTDNLATLQQHPLYVTLHATHPPLPDRMQPLMTRIAETTSK